MSVPMDDAAARLALSRARMRDGMRGRRRRAAPDDPAPDETSLPDASSWLALLSDVPIIGDVIRATRSVWNGSPLPAAAELAQQAGNEALRPTAQRHPLALVGVAMAGGALLVWTRPWQTLWRAALAAGVVSQLTTRLVAQIPMTSLLDAIQGFALRRELAEESQEGRRHGG